MNFVTFSTDHAGHGLMTIRCPLCASPDTRCRELIDGRDLKALYAQYLGIAGALKAAQLEYRECANCRLGFFWPLETGDEAFYEKLQVFDWYYGEKKNEFQIALRFLPAEGKVLEVGAGKAVFAPLAGVERYTGLEFNDKAIERARADGIVLLKESVESHALRNPGLYDAVVSFQVLEHVSSPAAFITACVACLKPGGTLILAVPSQDGVLAHVVNHVLDLPPHHVTRWSGTTLRMVAEMWGLSLIFMEHEALAPYHAQSVRHTRLESKLRGLLGMGVRLVDRRPAARLASRMAGYLARLSSSLPAGAKGHTVVAGYRKA